MTERRSIRRRMLQACAVLAVSLVAVFLLRKPLLRSLGWALVVQDKLEPADAIIVPEWTNVAGALEAADLIHEGLARQVVLISTPLERPTTELIRRGILPADDDGWIAHLLRQLDVRQVNQIFDPDAGTSAEGQILPGWCHDHQVHSIIVVSTSEHSRRVHRVLRRQMSDETKVIVRTARYSKFDPERWWQSRDGIRTEIIELEKLCLDITLHPF